jgi:hypothetical protein
MKDEQRKDTENREDERKRMRSEELEEEGGRDLPGAMGAGTEAET